MNQSKSKISLSGELRCSSLVVAALCFAPVAAQAQLPRAASAVHNANIDSAALDPISDVGSCADTLSAALQQDGSNQPCWADIRTVDHWNTMRLGDNATIQGGPGFLPEANEGPYGFSFAFGGLAGLLFTPGTNTLPSTSAQAYGGAAAISGYVQRRRWELMYEDGGALGDYQFSGAHYVGLNRGALRANGRLSSRWLMQGSVTNAYGNDTLRTVAPLDFRTVGQSEAPVTDTVAYGLHSGNLVDQQEDVKLRYATSRRTNWDFSAAHTFRYYSDDGVSANTVRGRAQYLHATSASTAFGVIGSAAHQTGPSPCTIAGGGLLGLLEWGSRGSLNISGVANGASSDCGKSVQFTGDASLYVRASNHADVYLTGNRDLSDGIIEQLAFLSSAGGGFRYHFTPLTSIRLSGAAIYGTDPKTDIAHNGAFGEAAVAVPLGAGFLEETAFRHYQIDKVPGGDNRNVVTFTVWWSPRKNQQTLTSAR